MRGINQFTVKEPNLNPSPELSYLLGVLKGDASLYKTRNNKDREKFSYSLQLAATDKEFVEYFNNILEKIFFRKVKIITYQLENSFFYRVILRSKFFYEWYNAKIEEEIFKIAENHPNEFIKGIFDSEGSLTNFKTKINKNVYVYPCVRICTSNFKLIRLLQEWLKKHYSIKTNIKSRIPKKHLIEGRMCYFNRKVYILGIFNRNDVNLFFEKIGTSIIRKRLGGW